MPIYAAICRNMRGINLALPMPIAAAKAVHKGQHLYTVGFSARELWGDYLTTLYLTGNFIAQDAALLAISFDI